MTFFIIAGVVIFVIFLFQGTKKEAEVVIEEDEIEIKGQYGTTINIDEITDVLLVESMPSIGKKVNSAGLGEFKKGDFEVEGIGTCRLFLHSEEGPSIYLIVNSKYCMGRNKVTKKGVRTFSWSA